MLSCPACLWTEIIAVPAAAPFITAAKQATSKTGQIPSTNKLMADTEAAITIGFREPCLSAYRPIGNARNSCATPKSASNKPTLIASYPTRSASNGAAIRKPDMVPCTHICAITKRMTIDCWVAAIRGLNAVD